MTRVFIFRHGETDWNAEGRFQGHIDVPMNDRGRAQAAELIPALESSGIRAILSSDLSRARETAQIVASKLGIPVFSDRGLREAHLGEAQGLTIAEIEARFGKEKLQRWRSSHPTDADVAYKDGESGKHVMQRVFSAMERFIEANPEWGAIGVSTHGGVIRRVMERILPPDSPAVRIPNCVVYELNFEREGRVWKIPAPELERLSRFQVSRS